MKLSINKRKTNGVVRDTRTLKNYCSQQLRKKNQQKRTNKQTALINFKIATLHCYWNTVITSKQDLKSFGRASFCQIPIGQNQNCYQSLKRSTQSYKVDLLCFIVTWWKYALLQGRPPPSPWAEQVSPFQFHAAAAAPLTSWRSFFLTNMYSHGWLRTWALARPQFRVKGQAHPHPIHRNA